MEPSDPPNLSPQPGCYQPAHPNHVPSFGVRHASLTHQYRLTSEDPWLASCMYTEGVGSNDRSQLGSGCRRSLFPGCSQDLVTILAMWRVECLVVPSPLLYSVFPVVDGLEWLCLMPVRPVSPGLRLPKSVWCVEGIGLPLLPVPHQIQTLHHHHEPFCREHGDRGRASLGPHDDRRPPLS